MIFRILAALILAGVLCADDQAPAPFNTQEITIPFLKPAEALKAIAVPKGFRVQLAAAEPMVQASLVCTTISTIVRTPRPGPHRPTCPRPPGHHFRPRRPCRYGSAQSRARR